MNQKEDIGKILVVGTVSVDRLHLADGSTHFTVGGAGMYTALAASRAGAEVTLLAPQPRVMTSLLRSLAEIVTWIGPLVEADELPLLEIAHHGNGRGELLKANWGAESQITIDLLPEDLSDMQFVHIAALHSARRQLDFVEACRKRNAGSISVGTYAKIVQEETETVRAIMRSTDLFFMNENEANKMLEEPECGIVTKLKEDPPQLLSNKKLFVTMGENGVCVFDEGDVKVVEVIASQEFDPTGAGDTFCGTTLAKLAQGFDPQDAAHYGNQSAAEMIQKVGPSALLN